MKRAEERIASVVPEVMKLGTVGASRLLGRPARMLADKFLYEQVPPPFASANTPLDPESTVFVQQKPFYVQSGTA